MDIAEDLPLIGEIRSAEVAALTSPDLAGLKRLINEASAQKAALTPDFEAALASRRKAWRKLRRREQFPLRLILKKAIPKAQAAFKEAENEAIKVAEALAVSQIRVTFDMDAETLAAQFALESAHVSLSRSHRIWDVTSSVGVDRVRERSAASTAVTRRPVQLTSVMDGIVAGSQKGLRFQNANGGDLDIFPGFMLMRAKGETDYALVDLRELRLDVEPIAFIESESVPGDSQITGYAWAKSNRDGSPDRRFKDNYQIPIVRYGELRFSTPTGIAEAYQVSNCEAALAFGAAFQRLQAELRRQAARPLPAPREQTEMSSEIDDISASLPALPLVGGAHEVTALAIAAICAPFLLMGGETDRPEAKANLTASESLPVASSVQQGNPVTPAQLPAQAPSVTPMAPGSPADGPVIAQPTPAGLQQQQFATVQAANVRTGPDRSTTSVRVVPVGTRLKVFERQGAWARVGDAQPWGWIHSSLLRQAP
ncbi:SH3 domain-containing protein [Microvirga sp. 2YAF29]|uniref:SH3 domain-containing protein n=1 Tax=Microvirga sp. 2YAF29 TaxID=3233031 RepID=UPI003F9BF4C0